MAQCGECRLLRVDLSTGKTSTEQVAPQVLKEFVGGRGVGSKMLYDEIDPTIDALAPENKLIFMTGPLTGTAASCGARYMVITKSPLTGGIACSNSGGFFGPELRFAGFDGIVFEGKSKEPVYLLIEDGTVELRSASGLWGMTTHETTDALKKECGENVRVACIGPAGEKLSRMAAILNDKNRAAGRSGVGAVMGSKNLKAVVVRGTGGLEVADREAFRDACTDVRGKLRESEVTSSGLPTFGTLVLVNVINAHGFFPTRNFRESQFATADKISGEAVREKVLVRNSACFACSIGCGRVTRVENPKYKSHGEGPEFETSWSLGAMCGIDDLDAVTKANYLCNELGLDTIEMGAAIACAMELAEEGVVSAKQIGRKLGFGDADALVELTRQTGYREGFGDDLAEGGARLAEKYGRPELFMGVKKQAFPAYDGRGSQGMGLNYATSNRGACHVRGYMISPEVFGIPEKLEPGETERKAQFDMLFQNTTAVVDSAGICLFTTFAIGAEEVLALLNAATGRDYTLDTLMQAGDRVWNLERLFNLAAGLSHEDDTLPKRILEEPIPEGPMAGSVCRLGEMLPEYYELRGWDAEGRPTSAKLEELALS